MKIEANDRSKGESRKKKTAIFLSISIIFFLFMVLISFIREDGIRKIWELEDRLELSREKISELKRNNRRLESEVTGFKEYDSQIEKVAREELGLLKEGETLYKFVPSNKEKE